MVYLLLGIAAIAFLFTYLMTASFMSALTVSFPLFLAAAGFYFLEKMTKLLEQNNTILLEIQKSINQITKTNETAPMVNPTVAPIEDSTENEPDPSLPDGEKEHKEESASA